MKISIFILIFGMLLPNSCKNTDDESPMNYLMPADNKLIQSMNKTITNMDNAKMNGDFDFDFANLMILHHQMAIDMSHVEINNGSDISIQNMANGIVVAQQIEIRLMQQFIKNYKIPKKNDLTSNSYKLVTEMKLMMANMSAIKTSENIDLDYVSLMIPHHESAVRMAKEQLKYGTQEQLVDLSKNVIEDQNFEINSFKNWLAKN
jgi:uncharacterized protein (DUF305 family)